MNENDGDDGGEGSLVADSTDKARPTDVPVGAGSPKGKCRSKLDAQVIAGLAVHILPPETAGLHDARDVTIAVNLASRILEEASKPKKEYAYEMSTVTR